MPQETLKYQGKQPSIYLRPEIQQKKKREMPAPNSPPPKQTQSHQKMKQIKRRLYFGYGSNLWREQMALRCPRSEFLGIARLPSYRWMINERGYANVAEVGDPDSTGTEPNGSTFGGGGQAKDGDETISALPPVDSEDTDKDEDRNDHQEDGDHDDDDRENSVWGAVYSLTSSDEAALDINEGVPYAYEKRDISGIEFWPVNIPPPASKSVAPILTDLSSGATSHHRHDHNDKDKTKTKGIKAKKPEITVMLVYIDFQRNDGEGYKPREEYIHRMNMGIRDALEAGMPRGYVEKVLRRWIPEEEEHSVDDGEGFEGKNKKAGRSKAKARELALQQARAFKDESGVIPSSGNDN